MNLLLFSVFVFFIEYSGAYSHRRTCRICKGPPLLSTCFVPYVLPFLGYCALDISTVRCSALRRVGGLVCIFCTACERWRHPGHTKLPTFSTQSQQIPSLCLYHIPQVRTLPPTALIPAFIRSLHRLHALMVEQLAFAAQNSPV